MTILQDSNIVGVEEIYGLWNGTADLSRTPSPGLPAKKMRMNFHDITQQFRNEHLLNDNDNLLRVHQTPESLGYDAADSFRAMWVPPSESVQFTHQKKKHMRTGCIPCLYVDQYSSVCQSMC